MSDKLLALLVESIMYLLKCRSAEDDDLNEADRLLSRFNEMEYTE